MSTNFQVSWDDGKGFRCSYVFFAWILSSRGIFGASFQALRVVECILSMAHDLDRAQNRQAAKPHELKSGHSIDAYLRNLVTEDNQSERLNHDDRSGGNFRFQYGGRKTRHCSFRSLIRLPSRRPGIVGKCSPRRRIISYPAKVSSYNDQSRIIFPFELESN